MQFDWSTFVLEAINFLILLWILKHFLYKPVMAVIRRRKEAVDQAIDEADATRQHAEELKTQYENRLGDWEKEKESARTALRDEMAAERNRQLETLQHSLAQEQEKARAVEERRQEEILRNLQQQAISHGGEFVSRLLARMASPELERRIVELALQDLAALPPERLQELSRASEKETLRITTAFSLDKAQRQSLSKTLASLTGSTIQPEFHEETSLLAGLRISAGPWVLQANLGDELAFFSEVSGGSN